MDKIFFEKVLEGHKNGIYKLNARKEVCDYRGATRYLQIFNPESVLLCEVKISKRELKMLDFALDHDSRIIYCGNGKEAAVNGNYNTIETR